MPEGLELHVSPTLGPAGHAVGRGPRGVQRDPRGGRRRGPGVFPRAGRGPDAHRLGRGRRPDRHGRGPHGDHLPHAGSLVERPRGPGNACAIRPTCSRPVLPAFQRGRPAGRHGRDCRHPGQASDFDRLGHPARNRGGRATCVPLVIMTHTATEGAMQEALQAIDQLACVHPGSVRMRVRTKGCRVQMTDD